MLRWIFYFIHSEMYINSHGCVCALLLKVRPIAVIPPGLFYHLHLSSVVMMETSSSGGCSVDTALSLCLMVSCSRCQLADTHEDPYGAFKSPVCRLYVSCCLETAAFSVLMKSIRGRLNDRYATVQWLKGRHLEIKPQD